MKRVTAEELLDTDSGTPIEIARALVDLRNINHWFGGVGTMQSMVKRVLREKNASSLSVLEVASGAGHGLDRVEQRMQAQGVRLETTLLDRAPSHMVNGHPMNGRRRVAADVFALPFADNSFDVVSCCLFGHHLDPQEMVRFVNESLRVCRRALLINDLIRHPLHLAMVYAGLPLFRSRITHHDAPASVRQAYTVTEMRHMLHQTNAARVEIERYFLFRMGAIAWK
jgi:ubiquinone/menaquinone biosynthesis C-methylase UbiE